MKEPGSEKLKTPNKSPLEVINSKINNIKYPFNGIAPNLIDKFLVLGYEQKTIELALQLYEDYDTKAKTRLKVFEFQERPTIVNEICNDYSKDLLDNDLILELMFPNIPKMFFLDKQMMNEKKEPDDDALTETYSIIFSINPQDNFGSKKSYNGLGYIFYYMQEHRNMNNEFDGYCYVPITYVILSEFPYFYHFNEICKNIYSQMKKENDGIPIDILIYNIVKYCPSPINKTINISFGADLKRKTNKKMTINKILEPLNIIYEKENKVGIPSIFFNQLSGYPIIDFNLSFIFNLIPPEIICEVFIFSFLEHDIIFYSQRADILNMVIYIFAILNYPFNDSIYYWHLLSVSKESFMSGSSTFVGKTCSTLTGILGDYDQELLTTKKIREHFVLDIDNKNFFFLFQEETKEVQETMDLYNYIKTCCAEADDIINETNKTEESSKKKTFFNDEINLYDAIFNLMEELERRAKKVTSVDYNRKEIKPTFLAKYEDESEIECMNSNMRLQKAFFNFITEITQNFLSILGVGSEGKKAGRRRLLSIQVNIKEKKSEKEDEEEEKKKKFAKKAGDIFKSKFKDCSKYSSFVINFCLHHDTIDIYKIPYTFINEFIYYSYVAINNNLSEVDVFKLIDQFYGKKKMIDFEDIIKDKTKDNKTDKEELENVFSFNFAEFSEFYKKYLREYINREQEDDREIFVKVKSNIKNIKNFKRNGFYLSNKILKYYINFSNKNYETLKKTFKLIKCKYKKQKKEKAKKEFNGFEIIENNENIIGDNSINENNNEEEEEEKDNEDGVNDTYLDYDLIESDDKTKKDVKFYGGYELMEITDVLEKHFILERCFSSYGLIKYSLLNILAITREIDKQFENKIIIEIMCDFCEITKSLVRKYMNIYIYLFQTLKDKDKDNEKSKLECEKCLDIISSYFEKTNMIPTEETSMLLKDTDYQDTKSNKISLMKTNTLAIKKNIEDKIKMEMNNPYFEEKKNKKFSDILKIIETIFSGDYKNNAKIVYFGEQLSKELVIDDDLIDNYISDNNKNNNEKNDNNNNKKIFIPKSPLSLYTSSNNLLNKYLQNFSNDKNIYKELCQDILSLLYYFKIPSIGKKWIEQYIKKYPQKYKDKNKDKNKEKIKSKEKNKETINPKEKNKEEEREEKKEEDIKNIHELNNIIKKIIYILTNLYKILKKNKL